MNDWIMAFIILLAYFCGVFCGFVYASCEWAKNADHPWRKYFRGRLYKVRYDD
jgi:hypothetical protein